MLRCQRFAISAHLSPKKAKLRRHFSVEEGERTMRIAPSQSRNGFTREKQRERANAFTLLELLIVVGIIGLLLVLVAPAFTSIKRGTDVTSAAYTIKSVLDTARTYAKANDTYTWVGFYEENTENPASPNSDTPAVGRLIMSLVASKDGTMRDTGNLGSPFTLDAPPATPPPDTFAPLTVVPSTAAQIGDPNFPPTPSLTFNYTIGSSSPQY